MRLQPGWAAVCPAKSSASESPELTEADLSETRITGTYRPLWEDREEAGKSGTEALLETAEVGQL